MIAVVIGVLVCVSALLFLVCLVVAVGLLALVFRYW